MRNFCVIIIILLVTSCTKDPKENMPPVVNAGSDLVINLTNANDSIKLTGSAVDADGTVVAYLWSEISGPNTPILTSPGSESTYVKDLVSGTYVFQLMATDDKGANGVKSLKLTISIPPKNSTENKPPLVNAGNDSSINLTSANDSIKLNGSATDVDGTVVGYNWSQISGPNTPLIRNPGAAMTYVKGFASGTYVFQLMATDDKGATGVKSVKLTVTVPSSVTLTLQPSNSSDVQLAYNQYGGDVSNPSGPEIGAASWTVSGGSSTVRSVLKFDLSSIPAGATITSAKLSLYSTLTPINGDLVHANYGSNNAMLIQRAVSNWSNTTVNWQSQPSGDASSQIVIPQTTQPFLDLTDIDVTNQVKAMFPGSNYGFLLKLQNESIYNSRLFYSSRSSDATKHPKLIIQYSN